MRQTEMYVISINGADEEDKRRVEKEGGSGCSITWALSARGRGRGKAALNMQQCKLDYEKEGELRATSSLCFRLSTILVLWQPLSSVANLL